MSDPHEPESPKAPSAQRPEPLDYAPSRGNPGGVPFIGQMSIGCGGFFVAVMICIGLVFLLGSNGASSYAMQAAVYIPMGLLLILGVVALIRWRWPGILAGIFSGVLLVGLIIGGLFLLVMSICGRGPL